jgi:hypothetical protein
MRRLIAFNAGCTVPWVCPYAGTGVTALHREDLPDIDIEIVERFSREDDVALSAALSHVNVRVVRPPTPAGWIGARPSSADSLYLQARKNGFRERDRAISEARTIWRWNPCDRKALGFPLDMPRTAVAPNRALMSAC